MKFRPQRGLLADAMAECVELPATLEAVAKHVMSDIADIEVRPYLDLPDKRIDWNSTFIVMHRKLGPMGFTDGPLSYPSLDHL